MRAAFGKVNTLHTHVLPWADRPLVTENLRRRRRRDHRRRHFGGAADSESVDVPRGDGAGVPRRLGRSSSNRAQRGDLSYVGHIRGYQDITESSNIDLGFSYAHGYNSSGLVDDVAVGRSRHDALRRGRDVRWKPLRRAIYTSFLGRGELDLEPARSAGRAAEGVRHLCLGRLSVRAPLVCRARYDRRIARTTRRCTTRAGRSS